MAFPLHNRAHKGVILDHEVCHEEREGLEKIRTREHGVKNVRNHAEGLLEGLRPDPGPCPFH